MNRSRWIALAVVLVVGIASIVVLRSRSRTEEPKYRTAAIEQGDLTTSVSATGTVRPVIQVEVGSQVSGTLERLFIDYNSRVRAGQVLAQLEPSAFRARVVQAQASVARAAAALKDAERQFARARELKSGDFVSQADVDQAEVGVEQRQADLKHAKAVLESADVDLGHTTIRSPIDGVVIARSIDVGQTVAASLQAPTLFLIANDLAQMQVETRIDEADIGRIHAGLPVSFSVDAFPDDVFEGTVSQVRLEPITEQNVVTYTTVIRTRNEAMRLRPGMTANVTVVVEQKQGVLKVPNAALRFRPAGSPGPGGPGRGPGGGGRPGGQGRGFAQAMTSFSLVREANAQPAAASDRRPQAPVRASSRTRGDELQPMAGGPQALKPGTLWMLAGKQPVAVRVMTGISDGSTTEVRADTLQAGMKVIVGLELPAGGAQGLQPPPGMGGPQFRGPGGGARPTGGGGGRR